MTPQAEEKSLLITINISHPATAGFEMTITAGFEMTNLLRAIMKS
jgi:hypothetical protein